MTTVDRKNLLKNLGTQVLATAVEISILKQLNSGEIIRQGYIQLPGSIARQLQQACAQCNQVFSLQFGHTIFIFPPPAWEKFNYSLQESVKNEPDVKRLSDYIIGDPIPCLLIGRLIKIQNYSLFELSSRTKIRVVGVNNHAKVS